MEVLGWEIGGRGRPHRSFRRAGQYLPWLEKGELRERGTCGGVGRRVRCVAGSRGVSMCEWEDSMGEEGCG